MSRLYKIKRFFAKYAIRNLMLLIVVGQGAVFVMDYFLPDYYISSFMWLSIPEVLSGEVWRLITFVFVPESWSFYFVILSLYFYYLIGSNLEKIWGALKFNLYYLLGVAGAVIAAFVSGGAGTNQYINISLFFAFAILVPDFEISLFFLIKVRIKWLAIIGGGYYIIMLIISAWSGRAAIIASLINVAIFFWRDLIKLFKNATKYQKTRNNYRTQMREWERSQKNLHNNSQRPPEVWEHDDSQENN